jgi:hypothetical protein
MTAILKGRDQLERSILPLLAKAITACEKYHDTTLLTILSRWRQEAFQYLSSPADLKPTIAFGTLTANEPQPQVNAPTNADDDSIDPELTQVIEALRAIRPDWPEDKILRAAAYSLQNTCMFDDLPEDI